MGEVPISVLHWNEMRACFTWDDMRASHTTAMATRRIALKVLRRPRTWRNVDDGLENLFSV
ncbi:hypothetical protein PG990_013030 [Apiospora arundinis]